MVLRVLCRYCWEKCRKIKKYIQKQLEEDKESGQISLMEYADSFTGKPTKIKKPFKATSVMKWCESRTFKAFASSDWYYSLIEIVQKPPTKPVVLTILLTLILIYKTSYSTS